MAPTIGVNLRVTGHCNQGGRKYMEDMFSVAYQQTADKLDLEYAYFGIFDGHGGHEAATFAKEHLMKAIVSQSGFWSDKDEDVLRAIKDGFIATHYAMWRNVENWPKTQSGLPSTSGTTASIAFIRRSNIYIGHVGDSRIVLGYQDPVSDHWKGASLTEDHKPESPQERERINQAGGQVICKAGVPRVVWQRPRIAHRGPLTRSTHIDHIPFLAVARSLGDLWSYNADSDRFVVSPEPDVFVHHIDLSRDRCLIFGTDGLWNMLSPNEAVCIVKKAELNNNNSGCERQDQAWLNPSKCLVDSAITKWTDSRIRADNTSAITLLLDPSGPPHSQVLDQQNAATQTESEFVPYHIESYKVNEGKSPSKLSSSQTSGLAICTWYPHKNVPENLNKNSGLTTLKTMEQLFGEKIEIYDVNNEKRLESEEKQPEANKPIERKSDNVEPSTSKATLPKEIETKKLPLSYSSVLRNAHRNTGHVNKLDDKEKTASKPLKDNIKDFDEENKEDVKREEISTPNENQNQEVDENVNKMRLRGNPYNSKESERTNPEPSLSKNCLKGIPLTKSLRQNRRRGKKRKNYEILRSQLSLFNDTKILRSKNKRRHSSLVETNSMMYEPGPKRRTKSEDQRKNYESEDYKSDTENKLDEVEKTRRIKKKLRTPEPGKETPETSQEARRLSHLQERLHLNNNNNNNNNNEPEDDDDNNNINNNNNNHNNNNNNNSDNSNNNNSNYNDNSNNNNSNNNSSQGFSPMRLRSNMPVKTLRSRNVNLENCGWFLVDLPKINLHQNKKSISKQNCKNEELADSTSKNLSRIPSVHTRSSLNSSKIQINEATPKATVHTRSQNKRLKK